jgi:hypothetical protein
MSEIAFNIEELRRLIETIDIQPVKMGFMYAFLTAGDVSEVWGKNTPSKKDMIRTIYNVNDEKIPAIVFKINQVRSKYPIRLCALPENEKYDPWTKKLFDWFQDQENEKPFHYKEGSKKINTYISEPQKIAKTLFSEFMDYSKTYSFKSDKIEYKDSRFTLKSLRNIRLDQLRHLYHFSNVDLSIFTGRLQYVTQDPVDREHYENTFRKIDSKIKDKQIIDITEKYFEKLLLPFENLYIASDPVSLHIKNRTELEQRFSMASGVSTLIQEINLLGEIKLETPFFKENMELILQIINPCNDKDDFTVKIANLSALFEVSRTQLVNLVEDSNNKGTIKLTQSLFNEKGIPYDESMFDTWLKIRDFRNMYPTHSELDPKKYRDLLIFFNEPLRIPPVYSRLWDNILSKFITSLQEFQTLLNDNLF